MKNMVKNTKEKELLFFNKVLVEMFRMVGLKYTKEYCQKKNWYLKRSFDKKQEKIFREFYIKNAAKDLRYPRKQAENEYQWFNLMFGWTSKK